jgi:cell division septum initiation protein DivIVA
MSDLQKIDVRLAAIEAGIDRLQREIDDLEEEAEELREAKATILRYFPAAETVVNEPKAHEDETNDTADSHLSKQQKQVIKAVPFGKVNRVKPVVVVKRCPSLDASYIRTTLWRFAQDGRILNEDGFYWRPLKLPQP